MLHILLMLNALGVAHGKRFAGTVGTLARHVDRETEVARASMYSAGDLVFERFELLSLLHTTADSTADPKVPYEFPKKLQKKVINEAEEPGGFPPTFLGTGSFGETWLVKDKKKKGQELALKLFYTKEENGVFTHLSKKMLKDKKMENLEAYEKLERLYTMAVEECKAAQSIEKQAKTAQKHLRPFSDLFMKCYDYGDDPAFVLLSYGGSKELTAYLQDHRTSDSSSRSLTAEQMATIVKQIIQGLDLLSNLKPPLIHHDLKSENVVINEVDGKPVVTIIDFGNMMKYEGPEKKDFKPTSLEIAPPEFDASGSADAHAFTWCGATDSKKKKSKSETPETPCQSAFDVYAAGTLLFEMLTSPGGIGQVLFFKQNGADTSEKWFKEIEDLMNMPGGWLATAREWFGSKDRGLNMESFFSAEQQDGHDFLSKYMPLMLNRDPALRPKPSDMLMHSWLQN